MKFVVEPSSNGTWVAVKPGLIQENLVERLFNSDILVSDLDDTDAPSPAKEIARNSLTSRSYLTNPKFWLWVLGTEYQLAKKGRNAESYRWSVFIRRFLRDPQKLARLSRQYTPEFVAPKLYQGVREFYDLLPWVFKIYLTRNIKEVGEAFREAAGFNEVMAEQFDKQEGIQRVVKAYPERKRFVIKGDSAEDEAMLDVLNELKRRGKIEEVTPIYIADSPNKLNPRFDINIGRDYNGLVRLIKEISIPIH